MNIRRHGLQTMVEVHYGLVRRHVFIKESLGGSLKIFCLCCICCLTEYLPAHERTHPAQHKEVKSERRNSGNCVRPLSASKYFRATEFPIVIIHTCSLPHEDSLRVYNSQTFPGFQHIIFRSHGQVSDRRKFSYYSLVIR
jgi:hypothetical protein